MLNLTVFLYCIYQRNINRLDYILKFESPTPSLAAFLMDKKLQTTT